MHVFVLGQSYDYDQDSAEATLSLVNSRHRDRIFFALVVQTPTFLRPSSNICCAQRGKLRQTRRRGKLCSSALTNVFSLRIFLSVTRSLFTLSLSNAVLTKACFPCERIADQPFSVHLDLVLWRRVGKSHICRTVTASTCLVPTRSQLYCTRTRSKIMFLLKKFT